MPGYLPNKFGSFESYTLHAIQPELFKVNDKTKIGFLYSELKLFFSCMNSVRSDWYYLSIQKGYKKKHFKSHKQTKNQPGWFFILKVVRPEDHWRGLGGEFQASMLPYN